VTLRPRDFNSRPRLEAVRPLPRELDTPPVTKTYFVIAKMRFSRNNILVEELHLEADFESVFE
jgi:hypothetical protein